jgi:hypothetical protein
MTYNSSNLTTQNLLLFENLMEFFKESEGTAVANSVGDDRIFMNGMKENSNLQKMSNIINGNSRLSLRIIDWFVTNYAKKNDVIYKNNVSISKYKRSFRVYNEYKLKLKAYGKMKFDPFCRWTRITIPYDNDHFMETTIGQLNFFKWAIENEILEYIEENYDKIEADMNTRNSTSRRKKKSPTTVTECEEDDDIMIVSKEKTTTRKKREELSVSAYKCLKTETTEVVLHF